jgi:hypothetical protein
MSVVDDSFGHPLKPEERAAMPLMGGIMNHGFQCGMLWGAALAAGAQAYRLHGSGSVAEAAAVAAAQQLIATFRARNKNEINCIEITDLDFKGEIQVGQLLKFFLKGGPVGCLRMAAGYSPEAFSAINDSFSDGSSEAPSPPVSCATLFARQVGVSDRHSVMASGLAGGIGLSGGACGVLGAVIWVVALKCLQEGLEEGVGDNVWNSKRFQSLAAQAFDRFVKSSDYEFECSEIVGREFEDIHDHAAYLQDGGCSQIIDALAAG